MHFYRNSKSVFWCILIVSRMFSFTTVKRAGFERFMLDIHKYEFRCASQIKQNLKKNIMGLGKGKRIYFFQFLA